MGTLRQSRAETEKEAARPQIGSRFINRVSWETLLAAQTDSDKRKKREVEVRKEQGGLQKQEKARAITSAQLREDEELGLPGVRLLLADGGGRAELDHVGMTGQLFLEGRRVKGRTANTSHCNVVR